MSFFAPQGRHVALMGMKFGVQEVPSSTPNFTPIGATIRVPYRTPKTEIFTDLIKMWNINAPQERIACAIFTKFAEFELRFRMQ